MVDMQLSLLSLLDIPLLLIDGDRVEFANNAAKSLLGQHIESQDVRLALRNPDAIQLIRTRASGNIRLSGLSVTGSIWEMDYHILDDRRGFIALYDRSIQASVARAHADFVANASHELRTPLSAILGFVETLSDSPAGDDTETRARFLGTIKREALRMEALVADLMSLSRIEAVRHEAPSEEIDVPALCREVIAERSQDGQVSYEGTVDRILVAGDKPQLAQAIRNLIDNAEKYGKSERGTEVRLETGDHGWISLTITDHGEGIPPEHLPRLTERFYRTDAGRSRAAGGTGLGLAIVKHIAERHRGRFDISSRPGVGTTATIMLPAL